MSWGSQARLGREGRRNSLCPAILRSGTSFGPSLPCVCCMPRGGGAGSLANTEGNESLHTAASFTWICRSPFPCLPCFCRAGGRWHWPGGGAWAPPAWGKGRWCRRTGHRLGLEETGLEAWMAAPGQQQQEAYPEPGEGCRPGGTFENSSLKQLSEVFWVEEQRAMRGVGFIRCHGSHMSGRSSQGGFSRAWTKTAANRCKAKDRLPGSCVSGNSTTRITVRKDLS
ncbi:unnamed protein product [Caretta caretta]